MVDDQNHRTYRSTEPLPRGAPGATPASGADPLAELARLIGQNDPFAEFGRDNARRAMPPPAVPPNFGASEFFGGSTAAEPLPAELPPYGGPSHARQPYAAGDGFRYQDEAETSGHPAADPGAYEPDPYHPTNAHLGGEQEGFYDDVQPSKRRMGIMVIAAVFALAVIGTAGAFGYRVLFGASGPSQPPPVIKADTAPIKVVPATASKTPNKLITDRVADHAQDEKVVSREEKPVETKSNPAVEPVPQVQASTPPPTTPAALGSGVISSEPKKIHTIAIRPDQPGLGDNQPVAAVAPASAPAPPPPTRTVAPAPVKPAAPPRIASSQPIVSDPTPPPAPRQTEARPATPVHNAAASAPGNAPLSLSPDAPAAQPPTRPAAVAAPAPIARAAKPAAAAGAGGVMRCRYPRSVAKPTRRPRSAACRPSTPTNSAVSRP